MNKVIKAIQNELANEYKIAEKNLERANDEWKKPQDEQEANSTLLRAGIATGVMRITEKLSKLIYEMTDEDEAKHCDKNCDGCKCKNCPKNNNKDQWIDFKTDKKGNRRVDIDMTKLTEEERKEVAEGIVEVVANIIGDAMAEEDE